ncbi:MAG: PHP domain-containing protein [Xenococcaceae cyanobacterium]
MAPNMAVSTSTQPAAQNSLALKQVWETIQADSCPHDYNFHMHTVCSDGQLTPSALIEQAVAIGLKGIAITDHHSIRGYQAAQRWLKDVRTQKPQILLPYLWTGVEINADLLGTDVHILGYAFDPEHPAIEPYLQGKHPHRSDSLAASVIAALHQAGGLVVLAHPARYRLPADELIPAAAHLGIDGVEAYYAYSNLKPWKPSPVQTQLVKQLGDEYGLFTTCGTDTHGLNLLERV